MTIVLTQMAYRWPVAVVGLALTLLSSASNAQVTWKTARKTSDQADTQAMPKAERPKNRPNIVFIFADDMGIGDVSHNGGLAPTPNLDRLAAEGMRFTDAHTTSSVCTPSRYGLLTGRYNWRTRLQKDVFYSPHDKPLIKENEPTVASMLQSHGYTTGCVGKWHLGFGWQFKESFKPEPWQKGKGWDIDYSKPAVTPTSQGFDYFYGVMASADVPPYVYIENDRAVGIPTVVKAFHRPGAATEDFEAIECLATIAEKSVGFIDEHAEGDAPFFLYLPLTSPHTPIVPSERWQGKSKLSKYGDFLMETDWVLGEVLGALDKHEIADNTLVIFSTDNGCSPAARIGDLVKKGHFPSGKLRGAKADIYEGGHRVPTIARWPGVVEPASETARITSLVDFYATAAEIVGHEVGESECVDSFSFFDTLQDATATQRPPIVMHSINGSFAIRSGPWKLCFCGGSGGWSQPKRRPEGAPKWQLFNLLSDLAETTNLYESHPEQVEQLHQQMKSYIDNGRSTDGPAQQNDVKVDFP